MNEEKFDHKCLGCGAVSDNLVYDPDAKDFAGGKVYNCRVCGNSNVFCQKPTPFTLSGGFSDTGTSIDPFDMMVGFWYSSDPQENMLQKNLSAVGKLLYRTLRDIQQQLDKMEVNLLPEEKWRKSMLTPICGNCGFHGIIDNSKDPICCIQCNSTNLIDRTVER